MSTPAACAAPARARLGAPLQLLTHRFLLSALLPPPPRRPPPHAALQHTQYKDFCPEHRQDDLHTMLDESRGNANFINDKLVQWSEEQALEWSDEAKKPKKRAGGKKKDDDGSGKGRGKGAGRGGKGEGRGGGKGKGSILGKGSRGEGKGERRERGEGKGGKGGKGAERRRRRRRPGDRCGDAHRGSAADA